ncbi:YdcF family protein [Luteithermobacter gelatinilyticus]|uniref:YdcF family protein n=1 Tax=Luteithermobacter gelatinilyticus TaxID=2582913 RepID=UPI00143DEAC3|nr:YdcF family protein [Luteithermobacter gelatinilyticus]
MRIFFYVLMVLFLLWVGGFLWFLYGLSRDTVISDEKTDAVVALTGGANRLDEAMRLLEEGQARRLFISGVNEKVTEDELLEYLGGSPKLAACCIEIGKRAQNTEGNAREIAHWVASAGVGSVRVVTSLEHMPRAMVELKRYLPDLPLTPHPVGQWRPENTKFYSLAREYNKYLFSLVRSSLTDTLPVSESEF